MSIKVCNHEYNETNNMNMITKTYIHPSKSMGNQVARRTLPPPLYDVYTVDELKPKLKSLKDKTEKNASEIENGTKN